MKIKAACVAGLIWSASSYGQPVTFAWDYMLSASTTNHRDSQLLGAAAASNSQVVDALLDVQFEGYGVTGLVALKANDIYHSDSQRSYDDELIVQELFWQGSVFDSNVDVTLGKVRLDWGVGYGYRPLDVFKPYRRNPVGIQVEEGTGTAMASYFDMAGEWSLVYTDSSWTQQEGSELEQASEQQGVGLRRYALLDDSEWQALVYYDDVREGLVGGSVVTVLDPAWSVHGSALYQRKYLGYQQSSLYQPVSLETEKNGYQALIGLNWANAIGNNVILEYWYDSRSWGKSDWQNGFERVEQLTATQTWASLANSYAQGLNNANLVEHNIMFHWSLDSSSWSQWDWSRDWLWLGDLTPTFDVLYSPQDQGVIATQWLEYAFYDSGSASFVAEFAARFMTGDSDSLYANLPDKRMIFINLKGKF
ncbi:hypothetical protein [Vibrio hepatarius]|uniref:hypothetical protein n=1 Tax=Vibrio hepatarius TaxID=171383 RepID=UPI0037362880